MTICAAVASTTLKRIVTVSDTKYQGTHVSIEKGPPKLRALTPDRRWLCMFACSDVPRLDSLRGRVAERVKALAQPPSVDAVADAMSDAYGAELNHQIARALKKVSMDMTTFQEHGKARLPGDVYHDASVDIYGGTGVDLLVLGFNETDTPQLLTFDGYGEKRLATPLGYAAVGTGADVAKNWLAGFPELPESTDVAKVVYRLCEAKFVAEPCDGVGKDETLVVSLDPLGVITVVSGKAVEDAKKLWLRRRARPVPESLLVRLRGGLSDDIYGHDPQENAENRFNETRGELIIIMIGLGERRVDGVVSDDRWHVIEHLRKSAEQHARAIESAMLEWKVSHVKPQAIDAMMQRYASFVDDLREIRESG